MNPDDSRSPTYGSRSVVEGRERGGARWLGAAAVVGEGKARGAATIMETTRGGLGRRPSQSGRVVGAGGERCGGDAAVRACVLRTVPRDNRKT